MAIETGKDGVIYYNAEITDTAVADTLVFSTAGYIESSTASGSTGPFLDWAVEGYTTGMLVTLTGCATTTENNRIFAISALASGKMTVSETVTSGASPDTGAVVFTEAEPGIQVAGFYNWTLSHGCDTLEVTNFDNSSGNRNYIPGLENWSASAEKYFVTSDNTFDTLVSSAVKVRFFRNYVSSPSTGNPSLYWTGDSIVTGLDETVPVDTLVTKSLSFQGDGAITLNTQSTAWSSGLST